MHFFTCLFILALLALAVPVLAMPDMPSATLNVWPGLAPGETTAEPGHFQAGQPADKRLLVEVTRPQLLVFPAPGKGLHPTILVCPGGGYYVMAVDVEGYEITHWLNSLGYTAVMLQYRVPSKRVGALQDGQRALSLLRARAGEFGIDPKHLGVLGFSAGGHLCARLAAQGANRAYTALDAIDRQSCRPDFAALIYPAYLLDKETGLPVPEVLPHAGMPPVFLTQTQDDGFLDAPVYATALEAAGVPTKCAIYFAGGHGYGLRLPATAPAHQWAGEAAQWLQKVTGSRRRF